MSERTQQIDYFIVAQVRVRFQPSHSKRHKTGCTEATLQRVMLRKRFLHQMQLVALGQAFDGTDSATIRLYSEYKASPYRFAIDKLRTRHPKCPMR